MLAGGFSFAASAAKRDDLPFAGLLDVAKLIRTREISPVELTKAQLARIEALDGKLHSYARVMAERALAAAKKAEAEIMAGRYLGPLHGVPIAVKDLYYTAGAVTAAGCKVMSKNLSKFDATVVARFNKAGAVLLGKLHTTEGAMSGYQREFPVPRNPWGADRWPGVSSSGSGVATAAGLCYGSLGSDTGGSIRYPAAANGIVGLKPTYGRVSRYGVWPLAPSLDHVGPMTRRVADAAAMLQAIAGYDMQDSTSLSDPVPDYLAEINRGIKGVRLGFDEAYTSEDVPAHVAAGVRTALGVLEKLGGRVVPVKIPRLVHSSIWYTITTAETAAVHEATYPSRAGDYGKGFGGVLEYGRKLTGVQVAQANVWRAEYCGQIRQAFRGIDLLVCPSMASEAFVYDPSWAYEGLNPAAGRIDGVANRFFSVSNRFTEAHDFTGYPTLSLPCGMSPDRMPLSVQLVGHPLAESLLCRAGQAYESATEWHTKHPSL